MATRVLDALHRIAGASFAKLCLCSSWEGSGDLDNYDALVDTVCTPTVTAQVPRQCFLPACILRWDGQAWRFEQALGVVVDPSQSTTQWRHARTGCHHGWETVFKHVFGEGWKHRAASTQWRQLKGEFRDGAYNMFNMSALEARFQGRSRRICGTVEPARKRPRVVLREPVPWEQNASPRVEILGDSLLVISWLNGLRRCMYRLYKRACSYGAPFAAASSRRTGSAAADECSGFGGAIST